MFLLKLLVTALLWAFGECNALRGLQDNDTVQRHVVHLLPFDIKIALDGNSSPDDVNIYALKTIITQWMDTSFKTKSENEGLMGEGTSFDYVLLEIANRRELQEGTLAPAFYKAVFKGFSVWNLEGPEIPPVNPELVELIQRATFLEDKKLLELIRQADDYAGLGSNVLDVRAEVSSESTPDPNAANADSGSDKSLEVIITIAIVVACLAFCLLMFAVIWAWRTDRSKREAYKVGRNQPGVRPDETRSESDDPSPRNPKSSAAAAAATRNNPPPVRNEPVPPPERHLKLPNEIPAESNYPESLISDSVISDDVETSFTDYYKSSMPHQHQAPAPTKTKTRQPPVSVPQPVPAPVPAPAPSPSPAKELHDAASVSSMDSYGYSLDGYASSLGPAPKFPGGALNMPSTSALGAEDASDAELAPSENGDSEAYKY